MTQDELHDLLRDLAPATRTLTRAPVGATLLSVAAQWLMILSAVLLVWWWTHPLVIIAAVVFVGTRQHALLILMHEAAHRHLHPSPYVNDLLSDVGIGWLHLIDTALYRRFHLAHHAHFRTPDDPEVIARQGRWEWDFPKPWPHLLWIFVKQGSGLGLIKPLVDAFRYDTRGDLPATPVSRRLLRWTFVVAVLAVLWAAGLLWVAVGLWLGGLLCSMPAVMRFRTISEHYGLAAEHDLNSSRDYTGHPLLMWLLVPHHINLHLSHHLFPQVPCQRLPQVSKLLSEHPTGKKYGCFNRSFLVGRASLWRALTR